RLAYASSDDTRSRPAPKTALFLQSLVGGFLTLLGILWLMGAGAIMLFGPTASSRGPIIGAATLSLAGSAFGCLGVLKLIYMLRFRGMVRDHHDRGQTFAEKMLRRW